MKSLTNIVFLLLILLLAGGIAVVVESEDDLQKGTNYAFIIGIGDYKNWRDLESAHKGAVELSKILKERYNFKKENIVLLTDGSGKTPTLDNIRTSLKQLIIELKSDDKLLIYYSGHSREDEETGEVFWIPSDGHKSKQNTWFKLSYFTELISSNLFEAQSLCILAESNFSRSLLNVQYLSVGTEDLRYEDKIREKSLRKSREVIAFGDDEPYVGRKSDGLGVFTYYVLEALKQNKRKLVALESLLYDVDIHYLITKSAGTRLLNGRFRDALDEGGQFTLERMGTLPSVRVAEVQVSPPEGYAGDEFVFKVKTASEADEVYVEINDKKFYMTGSGTEWHYVAKLNDIGSTPYRAVAINIDGKEGGKRQGKVITAKRPAALIGMLMATVTPEKGYAGEEYQFTAKTEKPAKGVSLFIGEKKYEMEGSGREWKLTKRMDDAGTIEYAMAARNEDGVGGDQLTGLLESKFPLVNVTAASSSIDSGYIGDEFIFEARTDRDAEAVYIEVEGVTYTMKGKRRDWKYRKKLTEIGKKKFMIVASNKEGVKGTSGRGEVTVMKLPAMLANVTKVAVSPPAGYAGDEFMFRVETSAASEEVYIELQGKKLQMKGSGREWNYVAKLDALGVSGYSVVAINEDGKTGRMEKGKIITEKRPAELIGVVMAKVEPERGYAGEEYEFRVETDRPAKSVALRIGQKRHEMTGSDRKWRLKKRLEDAGTIEYTVTALNEDGMEGGQRSGIVEARYPLVHVADASTAFDQGYTGDEFVFRAKTEIDAESVYIEVDGVTYKMEGAGKEWEYRKRLTEVGKKEFMIVASNRDGVKGRSRQAAVTVVKLPAMLANISKVSVNPPEGYAGEEFTFRVETSSDADKVYVELGGKTQAMKGSGKEWSHTARMDTLGMTKYRIVAWNQEGKEGRVREGSIMTRERSEVTISVVLAEVRPNKGSIGAEYEFRAKTDRPAKGVTLLIGEDRYKMTGAGREWKLRNRIDSAGSLEYAMIAMNEYDVEGEEKKNTFHVYKERFIDNGDGTVTDTATNMMWLKDANVSWKARSWQEAVEYSKKFEHKGYKDWRLPTKGEWKELIDKSRRNPSLPEGHPFRNIITKDGYWSKSRHSFGPGYVWQVNLWYGKTAYLNKKKYARIWPVRYAGLD